MSTILHDAFFAKYHPATAHPHKVPFALKQGDHLLLIGDSMTEARKYSLMIETYLNVCLPELEVVVRNLGKGGETAEGFLGRIESECLRNRPTVATICYGMNDAGYINNNREAADKFRLASEMIIQRLKAEGVRVVLSSPGCIGRLPPWDFVDELNGSLDGVNTSLMYIRDEAAAIAEAEGLPFVDHFWTLYQACFVSTTRFGADYAVCGADDGVHPSWAGHVVMAYGFFKALGFDGNLGTFNIDMIGKTATADRGHIFVAENEGIYTFSSRRYPFCADGRPDKDWSIRSGMTLVPFNQEFNRMILKVNGATARTYRVAWTNQQNMLEEWHLYTPLELNEGVNLAEQFHINPFSASFRRIEDLIFEKQGIEANETWHTWEGEGKTAAVGLAENEARRTELLMEVKRAHVPITHVIRVEAQS